MTGARLGQSSALFPKLQKIAIIFERISNRSARSAWHPMHYSSALLSRAGFLQNSNRGREGERLAAGAASRWAGRRFSTRGEEGARRNAAALIDAAGLGARGGRGGRRPEPEAGRRAGWARRRQAIFSVLFAGGFHGASSSPRRSGDQARARLEPASPTRPGSAKRARRYHSAAAFHKYAPQPPSPSRGFPSGFQGARLGRG